MGAAFLLTYSSAELGRFIAAMGIALLAFLSDALDGRLARYWGIASDAGAILDGLGDKAFYIAVYLVIEENHGAATMLLWLLIFREIALYGLRVIDTRREATTKRLRWISLLFAFLIRIYFLAFFCEGALSVLHMSKPWEMQFSYVLAYAAAVLGVYGLALMIKDLPDQLQH